MAVMAFGPEKFEVKLPKSETDRTKKQKATRINWVAGHSLR